MNAKIKDELLAIKAEAEDGLLRAPIVVEWARNHPESALYAALEWNDEVAAQEFRIHQVRRLISLHVLTEAGEPQLVSLSFDRTKGGGYRDVGDVVKSRDLSAIMLADALAELERVQAKYERVKELIPVWEEATKVRRRRRAAEAPAQAAASA